MQLRVTLLSPSATFKIPLCFSLYLCASVVVRAVQIDLTRLRSRPRLNIFRPFGARKLPQFDVRTVIGENASYER